MKLFTSHKPNLEDCPPKLKTNILDWKNANPEFEFEYFNDTEMLDWIHKNTDEETLKCFNSLNTGAGRADLYRIRKLYVEGGIWFDADLPPVNIIKKIPNFFDAIKNHGTAFFVTRKTNEPRFMIMASIPSNFIFYDFEKQICKELNNYIKSNEFVATINLTGPKAFHRCMCKYLKYDKISDIKVGQHFSENNVSFIFLEDVVDYSEKGDACIMYKGYRKELEVIGSKHHKFENAYILENI
jgi:mannosyltransferase OCH1-like enzyme